MNRFKQKDVLWIVRGIRLGRFLRCCGQMVRRAFDSIHPHSPVEPVATSPPTAGGAAARRKARRRRVVERAPCKGRKPPALDPATLIPSVERQSAQSSMDH